jgi:hypothetical protein
MILGEPMKTKIRKEIFEGISFFDSLSAYQTIAWRERHQQDTLLSICRRAGSLRASLLLA